jgi:hypothetical protein
MRPLSSGATILVDLLGSRSDVEKSIDDVDVGLLQVLTGVTVAS